ncbi:hypothetical protein OJ962_15855 [Solirubrobacter sp. CPCC 204708]|uniref:Uncharacterized protein n=1 Tax=Solirubrobacter deserti TaxID=2282478 RepID=A0ABT4RKD0_9ACTN|nr:hypothetical protein [Solirubrobacter deserti]
MATTPQTHAWARNSSQPSRRSRTTEPDGAAISPRARGRMRARNHAETTNVAASSANAHPAPTPSTSSVASAGPANSATVLTTAIAEFASWTRSSLTVWGTNPVMAGRKNASAAPNTISITTIIQTSTTPVKIRTASSACTPPRIRSVTSMSRCRGSRSAQTPPNVRHSTSETV